MVKVSRQVTSHRGTETSLQELPRVLPLRMFESFKLYYNLLFMFLQMHTQRPFLQAHLATTCENVYNPVLESCANPLSFHSGTSPPQQDHPKLFEYCLIT